jgi:hypothetical protein
LHHGSIALAKNIPQRPAVEFAASKGGRPKASTAGALKGSKQRDADLEGCVNACKLEFYLT